MRHQATRGGEEHTHRFGAPTARGSSRTSTSTPNQPAVATTRQETTSHAETAEEIGHYGHHSRGARLWASASWYYVVTCCANKMQRQKKTCRVTFMALSARLFMRCCIPLLSRFSCLYAYLYGEFVSLRSPTGLYTIAGAHVCFFESPLLVSSQKLFKDLLRVKPLRN